MSGFSIVPKGSLGISSVDERSITANEPAPSLITDGISCFGYSRACCSIVLDDATSIVLRPYVYLNGSWTRVLDSSASPVSYTLTNSGSMVFDIAGFERFILSCSTTDGDLAINTVCCGPNL